MVAHNYFNRLSVHGVEIDVHDGGTGNPILVLHGENGPADEAAVWSKLEEQGRVLVPTHPGYDQSPELTDIDTVDDLAYLYLDLLDILNLQNVAIVGASLGGWIAAEMAIKSTARISRLVLAAPVGIKVGDRETRDIPDIFALAEEEVSGLLYHDPLSAQVDYAASSVEELTRIARNREATALYGWEPYFHDPRLRHRMHRITVPTLILWGASDGFVTPQYYGRAYQKAIPGAQFHVIEDAGHWPHIERPVEFIKRVRGFLES